MKKLPFVLLSLPLILASCGPETSKTLNEDQIKSEFDALAKAEEATYSSDEYKAKTTTPISANIVESGMSISISKLPLEINVDSSIGASVVSSGADSIKFGDYAINNAPFAVYYDKESVYVDISSPSFAAVRLLIQTVLSSYGMDVTVPGKFYVPVDGASLPSTGLPGVGTVPGQEEGQEVGDLYDVYLETPDLWVVEEGNISANITTIDDFWRFEEASLKASGLQGQDLEDAKNSLHQSIDGHDLYEFKFSYQYGDLLTSMDLSIAFEGLAAVEYGIAFSYDGVAVNLPDKSEYQELEITVPGNGSASIA